MFQFPLINMYLLLLSNIIQSPGSSPHKFLTLDCLLDTWITLSSSQPFSLWIYIKYIIYGINDNSSSSVNSSSFSLPEVDQTIHLTTKKLKSYHNDSFLFYNIAVTFCQLTGLQNYFQNYLLDKLKNAFATLV